MLVWNGILVALFFSLSGYRYLGDSGIDRREILHDGTYRSRTSSSLLGLVPPGSPNLKFLAYILAI